MKWWFLVIPLAAILPIVGSGDRQTLRARGTVAEHRIDTTVDHEVARAYVVGDRLPSPLAIERQAHLRARSIPGREELARVARTYSPDVAALLFVETVAAQERNRRVQAEYRDAVRSAAHGDLSSVSLPPSLSVLFVPGWFYRENGAETGSDFLGPRRLFSAQGVDTRLVETDENGTVEENAEAVAAAIRAGAAQHRQVILVSASKSSAEVAQALGLILSHQESSHVMAWLSIGGVLRGSPIADAVADSVFCTIARVKLAFDGFDMDGLLSMRTIRQRQQFNRLQLPGHILTISYIPVPMSGDISDRVRLFYKATKDAGPGDGMTLLVDELIPNGLVLLEPGIDHFLDHPDKNYRTQALFSVLMNRLNSTTLMANLRPPGSLWN